MKTKEAEKTTKEFFKRKRIPKLWRVDGFLKGHDDSCCSEV